MITIAQKEADKSKARCKHGAVLTRGGSVLGKGCNSYKTHPKWGSGPLKTLHAEAAALRDALRRGINVRGTTIFVARSGPNSKMSRPCEDCQSLLIEYGVAKVVYTDENGEPVTDWPLSKWDGSPIGRRQQTQNLSSVGSNPTRLTKTT